MGTPFFESQRTAPPMERRLELRALQDHFLCLRHIAGHIRRLGWGGTVAGPGTPKMLENCKRFLEQRCQGGGWRTYTEIEEENTRLREFCRRLLACEQGDGDLFELAADVRRALADDDSNSPHE